MNLLNITVLSFVYFKRNPSELFFIANILFICWWLSYLVFEKCDIKSEGFTSFHMLNMYDILFWSFNILGT